MKNQNKIKGSVNKAEMNKNISDSNKLVKQLLGNVDVSQLESYQELNDENAKIKEQFDNVMNDQDVHERFEKLKLEFSQAKVK